MRKTRSYGRGIGLPRPIQQPTIQELTNRIADLETKLAMTMLRNQRPPDNHPTKD